MNAPTRLFKTRAIVLLCAGLMLIAGVLSKKAIQAQSDSIEDQILRLNIQRAADALSTELFGLTSIASQWSAWDSTRRFLENNNDEYIAANLGDSTFANLRLNLVVFIDAHGRIIYGKTFKPSSSGNSVSGTLYESLKEHLIPGSPLLLRQAGPNAHMEGILVLPETAMLIASRPISNNESASSPIRGTVILGRYLDKDELQGITKSIGLPVSMVPLVKKSRKCDAAARGPAFGRGEAARVPAEKTGEIVGGRTLTDVYGSPAVSLRVTMNGDVYGLGLSNFRSHYYAIGWLLVAGVVLLLVNLWVMNRSALSSVGSSVSSIRQALGKDNPAGGKDEFSQLTAAINEMLGTLEVAQSRSDELKRELAQSHKMAAIGDLVSTLAHDMSNPTNVIMMSGTTLSQLFEQLKKSLEERYGKDGDFPVGARMYSEIRDEIPALLQCVSAESQRMARVITELRNYARSTGDGYHEQHLDINAVTGSAIASVRDRLDSATKRFSIVYGDKLPPVRGNSHDLEQALANLIVNACEALTDAEKRIAIETRCSPDRQSVLVVVKDEGRGMEVEDMKKVKEPFFTTRRASGAAGLGLSVACAIVKKHGGKLDLQSQPGCGTTVTVTLPAENSA